MNSLAKFVMEFLKSGASLVISRPLARLVGLEAAIMYGELLTKEEHYANHGLLDDEGYFYSTIEDVQKETMLTAYMQRSAIKKLTDLNLIECRVKGVPATRYFKINQDPEPLLAVLKLDVQNLTTGGKPDVKNLISEDVKNSTTAPDQLYSTFQILKNEQPDVKNHTRIITNKTLKPKTLKPENLKDNNSKELLSCAEAHGKRSLFESVKLPEPEPKKMTQIEQAISKIQKAKSSGKWDKVTDRDLTHYFIQQHNEKFKLPISFDMYSSVSIFRENFIKAFDIERSKVCDFIDEVLRLYDQRPDKYDALTFNMIQKNTPLMKSLMRDADLKLRPKERKYKYNQFEQETGGADPEDPGEIEYF